MPGHSERSAFARDGRASAGRGRLAGAAALGSREVLADRIAAALVHHEPGWRLPRHSALARRYNVSTAEIDAAIEELAGRRLIRRLPDGQAYRSSPAEYLIPLEGVPGLAAQLDPMGGDLSCRSRQVSLRRVPEDIGWALGVSPADPVCVVRFLWTADEEPAAFATTYLASQIAEPYLAVEPGDGFVPLPLTPPQADLAADGHQSGPVGEAGALCIEMQPPPPSVARSLRLSPGQLAAVVTIRFDDPQDHAPVALTIAVCRPDMFRIVVSSAEQPIPAGNADSSAGRWTHAVEGWEP
jgi:DNA-binding GntR family transcriptional regulator